MKRLLTHNVGLKLLAIVLALWLWAGAAYEPEVTSIVTLPLQYRNLSRELEVSAGFTNSVIVEIQGPAGMLRRISRADTAVLLDFAPVTQPGEKTFAIGAAQVALPRGVRLVRALPAQLRFGFERSATRSVPVTVRFSGALGSAWRLAGFEASPRELTIAGPASNVAAVEVLETDPVNLSGLTRDVELPATVFVSEAGVRFISSPRVIVKVHVQQSGN